VDPGTELERVADALPRLTRLTLPGEWALGWQPTAPAAPPVGGWALSDDPSAHAPLARLLLRCAGRRAGELSITVMFPSCYTPDDYMEDEEGNYYNHYDGPDCEACFARALKRVEAVCQAAARRLAAGRAEAGGGGEGGGEGGQPEGQGLLPRVFYICWDWLDWAWAGWGEDDD
jgi:hypothetical protein